MWDYDRQGLVKEDNYGIFKEGYITAYVEYD